MKITKNPTLLISAIALLGLSGVTQAQTVFITSTVGNAAALDGVGATDVTALTLSGGGTINLTTSDVSDTGSLSMDADSMGHGNDKWGANQNWTFSLDQTISFDALTFKNSLGAQTILLRSTAWKDDAAVPDTGNWSFSSNGTLGTFSITDTSDFTAAGSFSNVAAGTSIEFGFFASTAGGVELTSFTISPAAVPEPSSFALLAGCFGLTWVMLRRRS